MRHLSSTRSWLLVIPVLLLAAWLAARGLGADAIWYDEYWSIYYAGGTHDGPLTPVETWNRVADLNVGSHELNPPGYYVLLNLWSHAVGWSDVAVRSLSLFLGLLGIAAVYRVGRALGSPFVGLMAAVATGVSAFYLYYLHEARAYVLFPLLLSAVLWAYWRIIRGRAGWRAQALFIATLIAVFYTHYLAALGVVAIALYHLIFVTKNRAWWRVPLLMGLAAVAFLPWLGSTLGALDNVATTEGREAYNMTLAETLQLLVYGYSNGVVALLIIAALGAVLSRRRGARMVLFLAATVLVVSLVANEFLPFLGHIRYLMSLFPLWALLFAFSIDWLRRRRMAVLAAAVVTVWLVAGVVNAYGDSFDDTLFRDVYMAIFRIHVPLDELRDVIQPRVQDGDLVAYYVPEYAWATAGAFDYYMYPLGVRYSELGAFGDDPRDYVFNVQEFVEDGQRIWLAVEPGAVDFRLTEFERVLQEADFTTCDLIPPLEKSGLTLTLYTRDPGCCCPPDDPMSAGVIAYDNGVALTHVAPLPEAVSSVLRTRLAWWQAETVPRGLHSVALHVLDDEGNLVAQADNGLPVRAFQCAILMVNVSALPPGQYTLHVILYEWQTQARVPGRLNATGERADSLPIGTFQVR